MAEVESQVQEPLQTSRCNSLTHSKMAELLSLRRAEVEVVYCAHAQGFPRWCESPGGMEAAFAGMSAAGPSLSDS